MDSILTGAIIPFTILLNLTFYILIARRLRSRMHTSTASRDATLTRAFLLLSFSWMVLWFPIVFFRITYSFVQPPTTADISFPNLKYAQFYGTYTFILERHYRYYYAEFVLYFRFRICSARLTQSFWLFYSVPFKDP